MGGVLVNLGLRRRIVRHNVDRALKHWMIAAQDRAYTSIYYSFVEEHQKRIYMDGYDATKDNYTKA